jgi:hypothetical protein
VGIAESSAPYSKLIDELEGPLHFLGRDGLRKRDHNADPRLRSILGQSAAHVFNGFLD